MRCWWIGGFSNFRPCVCFPKHLRVNSDFELFRYGFIRWTVFSRREGRERYERNYCWMVPGDRPAKKTSSLTVVPPVRLSKYIYIYMPVKRNNFRTQVHGVVRTQSFDQTAHASVLVGGQCVHPLPTWIWPDKFFRCPRMQIKRKRKFVSPCAPYTTLVGHLWIWSTTRAYTVRRDVPPIDHVIGRILNMLSVCLQARCRPPSSAQPGCRRGLPECASPPAWPESSDVPCGWLAIKLCGSTDDWIYIVTIC